MLGDINVDHIIGAEDQPSLTRRRVGGTAVNAALAFRKQGFCPTIIGALGTDDAAQYIESYLSREHLPALLMRSRKPSGQCHIVSRGGAVERSANSDESANSVDPVALAQQLDRVSLEPHDVIFVATHMFARSTPSQCAQFFSKVRTLGGHLVVDLVPHDLPNYIEGDAVQTCIAEASSILVSEWGTIRGLFHSPSRTCPSPTPAEYQDLLGRLRPKFAAIRYGKHCIEFQAVVRLDAQNNVLSIEEGRTYHEELPIGDRTGYGDQLTARLVRRLLPYLE